MSFASFDRGLFDDRGRMTNEPYPGAFSRYSRTDPGGMFGNKYIKAAAAGTAKFFARRWRRKRDKAKFGPLASGYIKSGVSKHKRFKQRKVHREAQGQATSSTFLKKKSYQGRKTIPKLVARQNYTIAAVGNAVRLAAATGLQAAKSFALGNTTDLQVMASKYIAIGATAANKFFLEAMSATYTMTNQSNICIKLEVYDVECLRDCNSATNNTNPETAWNAGLVNENAAGLYTDVGVRPWQSDLFNQYFKIKAKKHLDILPGAGYTHTLEVKPMRFIHQDVLSLVSAGLRGVTEHTLFVIVGYPAHDSTTKTQVSTGAVSMDIIATQNYQFGYVAADNVTYTRIQTLPGNFAVGEETMNEELGELQNAAGLTAAIGAY